MKYLKIYHYLFIMTIKIKMNKEESKNLYHHFIEKYHIKKIEDIFKDKIKL